MDFIITVADRVWGGGWSAANSYNSKTVWSSLVLFDGGSHYGCWATGVEVEPASNDNKKDVFFFTYSFTFLY